MRIGCLEQDDINLCLTACIADLYLYITLITAASPTSVSLGLPKSLSDQVHEDDIGHPAEPSGEGQCIFERHSPAQENGELPPQHDSRIGEGKIPLHPLLVAVNVGLVSQHGHPAQSRCDGPRGAEHHEAPPTKVVQVGSFDDIEGADASTNHTHIVYPTNPRVHRVARVPFARLARAARAGEELEGSQCHGGAAAPDVRLAQEVAEDAGLELAEGVAFVAVGAGEDEVESPGGGHEGGDGHELPGAAADGPGLGLGIAGGFEEGGGGGGGGVAALAGLLAGAEGGGLGAAFVEAD